MNRGYTIIAFIAGAVTGSAITWKILKKVYSQLAQEEIDSVKETFGKNVRCPSEPEEQTADEEVSYNGQKEDITAYAKKLEQHGYTNYSKTPETSDEDLKGDKAPDYEDAPNEDKPFYISPEEYGENEGSEYDQLSYTYYANGIVTDENDEPLTDLASIGGDPLDHFGEYDINSVYVRNNLLKTDFEILRVLENYEG